MKNELDLLREWGSSIRPTDVQVRRARQVLESELAARTDTADEPGRSLPEIRRPLILAAAVLLITATAVAAVFQFSPERSLLGEGRQLVPGSLEQKRSEVLGNLVWTAYTYQTDDGLDCLDLDLTRQDPGGGLGSVGSCSSPGTALDLHVTLGSVQVDGVNHQVMGGLASDDIIAVHAEADGQVLTDVPISGVWIITPEQPARTWIVRGLNDQGAVVASVTVTDADTS